MDKLDEAYELIAPAAPGTAPALLVGNSKAARSNAIAVLHLAMMLDKEDRKFMRCWLAEQQ